MPNIINQNGDIISLLAASAVALDVSIADAAIDKTIGGIFVGTGGDVDVTLTGGTRVIYKNVPSGTRLRVIATIVHTAGTTATHLLAQY